MRASRTPRLRWIVVAGLVVLLLLAAVAVLPWLVDAERYRPAIERMLGEQTGWEAQVGAVEFSLWSGAALRAEGVSLAAAGDSSRVEIGRLDLAVGLWALLAGRLEVQRLELVDPRLRLVRESPATGWLLPPGEATSPAPTDSVPSAPAPVEASATAWSLDRVEISGGRLEVIDRAWQPPLKIVVAPIDLQLAEGKARGRLAATALSLPGSLRALDSLRCEFTLARRGEGWVLEAGSVQVEDLEVRAEGELMPRLDLSARLEEAPLPALLKVAGAFLPLPFVSDGPSAITGTVRIGNDADGLRVEMEGEASVSRLVLAEILPPVEQARAHLAFDRSGNLSLTLTRAIVAGGSLVGQLRLPAWGEGARLSFDGQVRGARAGGLLAPLVGRTLADLEGPTDLDLAMTLDLGADIIGPAALGGSIDVSARKLSLPAWDLEAAVREKIGRKPGRSGGAGRTAGSRQVLDAFGTRVDLSGLPWRLEGIRVVSGAIEAGGRGTFDPLAASVDLDLEAAADEKTTSKWVGQYGWLDVLVGADGRLTLPLAVEGPLTAPSIRVDLSKATRRSRREKSKQWLDRLKRKFR